MVLLNAIQTHLLLAVFCALTIGLLVGSFLNVVIYRLPKMMEADWQQQCRDFLSTNSDIKTLPEADNTKPHFNLMVPASRCPHCGHKIKPWENIPVISYLCLGGKCSSCKAPISLRYPSIELVTGILSVAVIYVFGATLSGLLALVLTWCLIALTMIDIDTYLLPDDITLPLLWIGLIANSAGTFTQLSSALWGAVAGYLSLWSVYHLFKLITGKEGMGYGDFKLLAALGAWMGWQMLPQIILLSSLVGAVIGIAMMIILGRDKTFPFLLAPI